MSKTSERLETYQTQMSIYAEEHKIILASDVLDMIEQLQDDLKDDIEKVVEQINGMEVVLSVDDISADNLKFTNKILRLVKNGAIERIRKGGVE